MSKLTWSKWHQQYGSLPARQGGPSAPLPASRRLRGKQTLGRIGKALELERQHGVEVLIKFVVYPDNSGMWRVQVRQSPVPRPPPEPHSCRGLKCPVCARRR